MGSEGPLGGRQAFEFGAALCYTWPEFIIDRLSPEPGKGRMPVLSRHVTLLLVAALAAATICGCGNNPVALVDGVKITESEFQDRLVDAAGEAVLRDMINRELIEQAAQARGIEVTEEELSEAIEEFKAGQFPSEEAFNQAVTSGRIDMEYVKDNARLNVIVRKLMLHDVDYSEESLRKFFEEHKEDLKRPATVSISEIVVSSKQDAQEVYEQLKGGEGSFEELARQYSMSPSRDRGGEIPEQPIERIPVPAIREAAGSVPVGEVSEPFEVNGNWYLIKVRDRQPAREATYERDKDAVRRLYEREHHQPLQDVLTQQLEKTRVQVLDPRFQHLNEQFTPVPSEVPEFGVEGGEEAPAEVPEAPEQPKAPAAGEESPAEAPEAEQPAGGE